MFIYSALMNSLSQFDYILLKRSPFINNRDSAVSEYISVSTQQFVNVHTRIELKANLTSHYISINFKWEMQLFEITFDLEAPKE